MGEWPYFVRVNVLEVIQRSAEFLGKRGVDSPRLQVELMLAQVLCLPRMGLYLNFERVLSEAETTQLREMVKRRGQREPLQHILGTTSFCGLELTVNSKVLVPRPETEQLAESGWTFLNAATANPPLALDFGTGSGCLAIALAVKSPAARVVGLEVSEEALEVARQNVARHGVGERVELKLSDGFAALDPGTRVDLMVTNPPYIPSKEIETLEPEVKDHDPRRALDGGPEGLDYFERLAREAGNFLRPGGRLMAEFGDGQGPAVQGIFEQQKWIVEALKPDYSGRLRILVARQED